MPKGYKYVEGQDRPFICKCCGKDFTSEGGYNLHGPVPGKCEGGPGYNKGNRQGGNASRKKAEGVGCSCGGSVRLLSSTNELEARAIKAGAVSVCTKCDTLYK